ncbi:phosphoribosylanthranilate isomerase [Ktedonospora formicarum]|uniref:N-(5'-phosphoribosyl)anthranilate isomerase n=1 Tax=Ktedonospora formicarum TaxID=2778364 RepID=A0A8J3HUI5_9CHLR|nr:phosphoribosylanthranilate isomerase [Ktedonospora formicarum]GHO44009.1 N-(5'-phosphoribosyl)anthranilate isomerase [Ktedonospora formicarum]
MQSTISPRVKICCISSIEEAHLAVNYGASALGLVSAMPSGPGIIEEELITQIADTIPPGVASFLLTSLIDPEAIAEQQRICHVNTVQLVDSLPQGGLQHLRKLLPPGIAIVQVIHVQGQHSIDEALEVAPYVNAILLDSGNPTLPIKELGGTGRVHDWDISRALREAVNVPIFLAGGLNAENVGAAIDEVGPFGLDLCSSVRTNGKLDIQKLERFFSAIHKRQQI